jgi:hypothetical protein
VPRRPSTPPLKRPDLSALRLDCLAQLIAIALLDHGVEHLQRRSRSGIKHGLSKNEVAIAAAVLG